MDINTLDNAELAPAAVALTTGASPITLNPDVRYYEITTGGTAGVEVVDLPLLDLPLEAYANPARTGSQIVIALVAQTDPGDSVKITVNGQEDGIAMRAGWVGSSFALGEVNGGVILPEAGSAVAFEWVSQGWHAVPVSTAFNWDVGTGISGHNINLDAGTDVSGDGADASLRAGPAVIDGHEGGTGRLLGGGSTNYAAGNAVVNGGQASTTGDGGDGIVAGGASASGQAGSARVIGGSTGDGTPGNVVIQAGSNGDDTVHGRVFVFNLPTSDPAEPGQLYTLAGVMKVSAG